MSDNILKKMIIFSDETIKNMIENCVCKEAQERHVSQSIVIEDYILQGIAKNHPDYKSQIQSIFHTRYKKYIDKDLLEEHI